MNIDNNKLFDLTGLRFESTADALNYLQSKVGYLARHNKNLTNEQYYTVCDIESILNCITTD